MSSTRTTTAAPPRRPSRGAPTLQEQTPLVRRSARRAVGDLVRGLLAAAVLVLLLGAPPLLLWQMAPMLVPTRLPSLADVTTALLAPDDGTLFLRAVALVMAVAWATIAVAVVAEVVSLLRGLPGPRLPMLSVQQRTVSGLVAAVAVLFASPVAVATPPLTPVAVPAATAPPASAPVTSPTSTEGDQVPAAAEIRVVVHRGDTLWGIAEHELGDGTLYAQIADATRAVAQPDGRHLQDADRIYPGWVVMVPGGAGSSAPADSASTPTSPAAETLGPKETEPGAATPPPAASAAPSAATSTSSSSAPSPGATPADADSTDEATHDDVELIALDSWALGAGIALSAVTAAGLFALLQRRRYRQRRHRRSGERLPVAAPPVQAMQRRLQAAHDPFTVAVLDQVLRSLSARSDRDDTTLPDVRVVRVCDERIELHLASPSRPVAPFTATGTQESTWHLDRDTVGDNFEAPRESLAPYPALVTVGRDLDGALVLVDLESVTTLRVQAAASTAASVLPVPNISQDAGVRAVLNAAVVDLATSPWASETDVFVVGPQGALVTALAADHVRHLTDVDRLLTQLESWAADLRRLMFRFPAGRLGSLRARGDMADTLRPRVVVVAGPLTPAQRARLAALSAFSPHIPLAVLASMNELVTDDEAWTLALEASTPLALLSPAGLRLQPQQLDDDTCQLVIESLEVASAPTEMAPAKATAPVAASPGSDTPPPSPPVPAAAAGEPPTPETIEPSPLLATGTPDAGPAPACPASPTADAAPDEVPPAAPRVVVLGPVEVVGPRGELSSTNHIGTMTELITFLALHPHREHYLLDEALWSGERVPKGRRHQLISRARRWLGVDEAECFYLPIAGIDGYRLAPTVRSDWDDFRALTGGAPATASTRDLVSALDLVRDQPFAGVSPYRYAWADIDKQDMITAIADVAHEVAERALRDQDAALARRAAAVGMRVDPSNEGIWRDALTAESMAGNSHGVEALARRVEALADELGDDPDPETKALIHRLAPRSGSTDGDQTGAFVHAS